MEYFEAQPAAGATKLPLVFVHGSYHGGWCWAEHWLSHFSGMGHPVYAPSLRGTSGSPQVTGASNVQMDEHIADISAFIDAKLGGAQAPVLVGHSFGGMYCQKVAEAGLELRGLALLCSVPPSGTSGTVGRYLLRKPGLAWAIVRGFVLKQCATDAAVCRRIFFAPDGPPGDADLARYMANFGRDAAVGLDLSSALKQFPGRTAAGADGRADWLPRAPPVLVLGAEGDVVVDLPAVQETAAFYGVREELVPGPHEIMLGDWQPAAGTLEAWLRTL